MRNMVAKYLFFRLFHKKHLFTELLIAFEDQFTFYKMTHSHILSYFIPGPADKVAKGERSMNWVWYWNVARAKPRRLCFQLLRAGIGRALCLQAL